ncbi:SDR family NAD(P)-dependent oxidoreductase [Sphingomonas sp. GC_Shp_3]|uniref:SDR family NAD(P)-dependent oxidoreductase n=1 Tax=Sphingomonas sp. GC_Shp_3 TaxID=2937383 RepID=UPI00226ABD40|nr:SDR family NAD(P)-dependent oxidoreductase [Sphingomonas sp. GC_Shp_3]
MTDVFQQGGVAVITGGASGIGAAAACRFSEMGMKIVLFDRDHDALEALAATLSGEVRVLAGDVAKLADVERLRDLAVSAFGRVDVLMNNAGIGGSDDDNWSGLDAWRQILDVNLWGVVHGVHTFAPLMLGQGGPSAIINTGSKQGITNPPGHPAYAVSKAGIRTLTEQLAHGLRAEGDQVTAHLLVPGWTFTGMSRDPQGPKPDGAWTAKQVVDLMIARVQAGDFYILCPDNAVAPQVDAARIRWSTGDMTDNRPALSRWHPDWEQAFATYVAAETPQT